MLIALGVGGDKNQKRRSLSMVTDKPGATTARRGDVMTMTTRSETQVRCNKDTSNLRAERVVRGSSGHTPVQFADVI